MIYRDYGTTGKKVSMLGFGGMRFKDINNQDECVEMMLEAARGGVNYFDTAAGYFSSKSESVFGEAFTEFKRQDIQFYCATKTFKSDENSVRKEIENQLKRLKIDVIDFYHVWCVTTPENWASRKKKGVIEAFRKLKEEGLIRHICVSSHLIGNQIQDLLKEGVFEGVLFGYSAYNFHMRQETLQAVSEHSLGCAVMNPLGGGIIPENPEIFDFLKVKSNETVVEAALHFVFSHLEINTTLVGFGSIDEVRQALKAVSGYHEISAGERERIKSCLSDAFQDLCTGCRYCDNCPEGIPIPKLMDAYNYKKFYGNDQAILDRLRWLWGVSNLGAEKCTECGRCEELCTQHLPIIERLKEIARISGK